MADGNIEDDETDMMQEGMMHAGKTDGSVNCEDEAEVDSEKKEPPKHIQIIMQVRNNSLTALVENMSRSWFTLPICFYIAI